MYEWCVRAFNVLIETMINDMKRTSEFKDYVFPEVTNLWISFIQNLYSSYVYFVWLKTLPLECLILCSIPEYSHSLLTLYCFPPCWLAPMFIPSLSGRDFIAPCKCKGTSKFVHRDCLDHWRAVKVHVLFYYILL